MTPIVLLDMDGVVADFEAGCVRELEQMGVDPLTVARSGWSFAADVEAACGPEVAAELTRRTCADGFFAALPPIDGAVAAVEQMLDARWDVVVCTAPRLASPTCASEKMAWIGEHLPALFRSVVITKDKTLVRGDVLVDDKPSVTGRVEPVWRHVCFGAARGYAGQLAMPSWGSMSVLFDVVASLR